jgi:iron(III) transport system ATP-binding protein
VSSVKERVFVPPERRGIGMVFQSYAVWPHLNVAENVAYPLKARKVPKAEMDRRVNEVLDLVGLAGTGKRNPSELSGGQQQRVALARAIVFNPRLLLFDEPLSNLDAKLRERMRLEIRRLQSEVNITSLYVTHDQAEALIISDVVVVMDQGKIQQIGDPRSVYMKPANEFVAGFIGAANLLIGRVIGPSDPPPGFTVAVELAAGETSSIVCATPSPPESKSVVVVIRPEDFILHHQPLPQTHNVLAGKIVNVVYMGNSIDCLVRTGDLHIRIQANPYEDLRPGESIYLELPPERCRCVPHRLD